MSLLDKLKRRIFNSFSFEEINALIIEIFRFQYANNLIYKRYVDTLRIPINKVRTPEQVPFLPVEFFKSHQIVSGNQDHQVVFTSSGTTGSQISRHHICDITVYNTSLLRSFEYFYGPARDYTLLALLPSYLEREGSSLVYMVNILIQKTGHPLSGFYLHDTEKLIDNLVKLMKQHQKVILLGASYALLDLIDKQNIKIFDVIIMETGGMKGRQKELVRAELHQRLCKGFGVEVVHSEYGMTELLSQSYSTGHGLFRCPFWMRVLVRDINDPLTLIGNEKTGGINIIDLANLYSCSFIATQDLGITHIDGSFEVLGRFDISDIRGCNLMIA
jgi:phenylacetate-coenzyme A ligase PaaK-like adenylate-forming protein